MGEWGWVAGWEERESKREREREIFYCRIRGVASMTAVSSSCGSGLPQLLDTAVMEATPLSAVMLL